MTSVDDDCVNGTFDIGNQFWTNGKSTTNDFTGSKFLWKKSAVLEAECDVSIAFCF